MGVWCCMVLYGVWWYGGMVVRWYGGMVVWLYAGMVVWLYGGMVVWWYGGMVVWWYGGMVVRVMVRLGLESWSTLLNCSLGAISYIFEIQTFLIKVILQNNCKIIEIGTFLKN